MTEISDTKLRRWLRSWLGVEKKSRTDTVTFIGTEAEQAHRAGADTATLMQTLQSNPWVYAALYAIASAPSQVPFTIVNPDGSEADEPRALAFLRQPNPEQSFDDFVMSLMLSLELTGDAYLEWVSEGDLAEAYVLRADRMSISASRKRRVEKYIYTANGRKVEFGPDDIIHLLWPNPNDDLYGLAPVSAAERDLVAEYYAQSYNQNFFRNGARIDGVLQSDTELDEDSFRRIKSEWKKAYGNPNAMHRTAILENGLSYKPISATPRDMEFQDMRRWNREAVLAALGVPPAMVGVFEYANYANADVQKRMFWEETMMPKLRKLESGFSKLLRALFPGDLQFRFDVDRIPAMAAVQASQAMTLATLVREGILQPDEARARLGLAKRQG